MDGCGNYEVGRFGEQVAVKYLEDMGFEILERNWRCRFGEADIIAMDEDGTVVFVEVKTRRTVDAGLPEEAVTEEKQRRYERISMCYFMDVDWIDRIPLRFDCIGICITKDNQAMVKHHRNCFDGRS